MASLKGFGGPPTVRAPHQPQSSSSSNTASAAGQSNKPAGFFALETADEDPFDLLSQSPRSPKLSNQHDQVDPYPINSYQTDSTPPPTALPAVLQIPLSSMTSFTEEVPLVPFGSRQASLVQLEAAKREALAARAKKEASRGEPVMLKSMVLMNRNNAEGSKRSEELAKIEHLASGAVKKPPTTKYVPSTHSYVSPPKSYVPMAIPPPSPVPTNPSLYVPYLPDTPSRSENGLTNGHAGSTPTDRREPGKSSGHFLLRPPPTQPPPAGPVRLILAPLIPTEGSMPAANGRHRNGSDVGGIDNELENIRSNQPPTHQSNPDPMRFLAPLHPPPDLFDPRMSNTATPSPVFAHLKDDSPEERLVAAHRPSLPPPRSRPQSISHSSPREHDDAPSPTYTPLPPPAITYIPTYTPIPIPTPEPAPAPTPTPTITEPTPAPAPAPLDRKRPHELPHPMQVSQGEKLRSTFSRPRTALWPPPARPVEKSYAPPHREGEEAPKREGEGVVGVCTVCGG